MINPTGKKLEKLLFGMFDDDTQGVDVYNHNGSMWIIFTDEMRWVLEFTKDRTLYYNYPFFRDKMEMLSLDCIKNKDLIQKWFESRFLNINTVEVAIQNGVKNTQEMFFMVHKEVEVAIQNGVKHTEKSLQIDGSCVIEDTIQNGVKYTQPETYQISSRIGDTIQNGVKYTESTRAKQKMAVEDTIQNGVKDTFAGRAQQCVIIEDTIQNGVKKIHWVDYSNRRSIVNAIRDGIKEN